VRYYTSVLRVGNKLSPPPTQNRPPLPPPLDQFNAWADYWYYDLGLNIFPADTRKKITYIKWSEWQVNPIPEELFNEWKATNAFAIDMAVVAGKAWRGRYEGKYFTFIDLDNVRAVEEFCTKDGKTQPLKEAAKIFLIEQHLDDSSKAHYFSSATSQQEEECC